MTISKIAAIALATLVAGAAAPVLAVDSAGFDSSVYLTQLRYDGINALDASDRGDGTVVVTVKLDDGRTVFQYFDKDSYLPIKLG